MGMSYSLYSFVVQQLWEGQAWLVYSDVYKAKTE